MTAIYGVLTRAIDNPGTRPREQPQITPEEAEAGIEEEAYTGPTAKMSFQEASSEAKPSARAREQGSCYLW